MRTVDTRSCRERCDLHHCNQSNWRAILSKLPTNLAEPDGNKVLKVDESSTLKTILLAEDDVAVREVIELCLESLGYRVVTAVDGEAALEHLTTMGEEIELLITDRAMPRLGGLELCEQLQKSHPRLKKLLISGQVEGVFSDCPLARRGIAFMNKPFSLPVFAAKVRELLDGAAS
jgi:CheY-like chemotaxis protein